MRRRSIANQDNTSVYLTGSETSGSMLVDFFSRLLIVLGLVAPPLTILAVVAYYASRVSQ